MDDRSELCSPKYLMFNTSQNYTANYIQKDSQSVTVQLRGLLLLLYDMQFCNMVFSTMDRGMCLVLCLSIILQIRLLLYNFPLPSNILKHAFKMDLRV